jgi:bud site selection protein 20
VPGGGCHYCIPCSKYFTDAKTLASHSKTKPHKRRLGELVKLKAQGVAPHSQADAERAGGLGAPDNGPRLRPQAAAIPMAD